jgi:hypothetical protein
MDFVPLMQDMRRVRFFIRNRSHQYFRRKAKFFILSAVWQSHHSHEGTLLLGKTNEDGHAVQSPIDESLRIVDRIDPHAQILHGNCLVLLECGGRVVESDGGEVEVDGPRVLRGFLADDPEVGEEVVDPADEHGLYLVVCLDGEGGTSVTGSFTPFSYFFRSGFSAHSLAIRQALKVSWDTTLT